jgi:hypothetical protein
MMLHGRTNDAGNTVLGEILMLLAGLAIAIAIALLMCSCAARTRKPVDTGALTRARANIDRLESSLEAAGNASQGISVLGSDLSAILKRLDYKTTILLERE